MAVTPALVTQAHVDNYLLDKPLLVGDGAQEKHLVSGCTWRQPLGTSADADDTDADYPTRRAFDRRADARTRPTTATDPTFLVFRNNPSGSPFTFDCFALLEHNLGTLGARLRVEVADNATFATNLRTVYDLNPVPDNARIFARRLDHTGTAAYYGYRDVEHARIRITGHGATRPEIGEAFFGQSRQMPHGPQHPWDPDNPGTGDFEEFRDETGDSTIYGRGSGYWNQALDMKFAESTKADIMREFWVDARWGRRKGLLVPRPYSEPERFYLVSYPAGLVLGGSRNPENVRYTLPMIESRPFQRIEEL